MVRQPSEQLRAKLRAFVPDEYVPEFGSEADEFAGQVYAEVSQLVDWFNEPIETKRDLQREFDSFISIMSQAESRVSNLSDEADRLLGVEAEPKALREQLSHLLKHARKARDALDEEPKRPGTNEFRRGMRDELALRVLRVCKDFGIEPSQTYHHETGQQSRAVEILVLIGEHIGTNVSPATWSETISAVQDNV